MAHGWGGMAAPGQSLPSASRSYSCAAPLVLAACCTPARVFISLSFVLAARCPIVCTRLSRRPSAALTALQELLYQSLQVLVAFEAVTPSSSSRAGCPSPATRPVRALRCEPVACRRQPALASRGRGACGPTPGAGSSGQGGLGWVDAVGGKGRLIFLYSHRATARRSGTQRGSALPGHAAQDGLR
jgi:hypothetical protein